MPKTRQQKEETVQKLQEKLGKAKAVVFADYKGLTMKQLSALREQLRDQQAEFSITKNTLLKRSIENCKLKIENSAIEGPTATLFAYDDQITPIKILVKALKDTGLGKVKMGFMGPPAGGELLDETMILKLATLPGKDELRAQTVGVLVTPLQGMVSVLQGNLRNLVYALSEIQQMKGGE